MSGGRQGRIPAKRVKSLPASAGLLSKYIIKGISSPTATERSVAVSTSLSGQPEILLPQAVTSRLLQVLRGTPNVALPSGRSRAARIGTRAGGAAARGRR